MGGQSPNERVGGDEDSLLRPTSLCYLELLCRPVMKGSRWRLGGLSAAMSSIERYTYAPPARTTSKQCTEDGLEPIQEHGFPVALDGPLPLVGRDAD